MCITPSVSRGYQRVVALVSPGTRRLSSSAVGSAATRSITIRGSCGHRPLWAAGQAPSIFDPSLVGACSTSGKFIRKKAVESPLQSNALVATGLITSAVSLTVVRCVAFHSLGVAEETRASHRVASSLRRCKLPPPLCFSLARSSRYHWRSFATVSGGAIRFVSFCGDGFARCIRFGLCFLFAAGRSPPLARPHRFHSLCCASFVRWQCVCVSR